MAEEKTHRQKLEKIVRNDLYEWFNEFSKDAEFKVEGKIRVSSPFHNAISQLEICMNILGQYEAAPPEEAAAP